MTLVLPTTQLRDRLSAVLDEVASGRQTIFITRRGQAQAVLLSAAEYEALTAHHAQAAEVDLYAISQASLSRIWEHPDEDVYTWADGQPL